MDPLKYLTPELLVSFVKIIVQDKTDPNGESVNNLLKDIFDKSLNVNFVTEWFEVIKLLLQDERMTSSTVAYVIRIAVAYGYFDIVNIIANNNNIDSNDLNHCVCSASEMGHYNIVKLLLQDERSNPSWEHNSAITYASQKGHFEVVRILLNDERIDLSICNYLPSSHDNKMNLVKILYENDQYLSKFDPEKLIKELLQHNNEDIAAFVVSNLFTNNLTDKIVIDFARKCGYACGQYTKIINIMKSAGIKNVRIKIGSTETKITEVIHKDGKDELVTTHIKH